MCKMHIEVAKFRLHEVGCARKAKRQKQEEEEEAQRKLHEEEVQA